MRPLGRLWWTAFLLARVRGQARYPFRPWEAIRRDQSRRVQRIVAYAFRHVPHYREAMDRLDLTPADFRTADDLARLPLIEREELQRDPERFLSSAVRPDRCARLHTGGSTAAPITVFHDPRAMFEVAAASERFRAIVRSLVGRARGYRETTICSPADTAMDIRQFWHDNTLLPRHVPVRRQRLPIEASLESVVARINEFRPDVIGTYGSYLETLFAHVHSTGAAMHLPKLVGYGADCLPAAARRLISEAFGVPVFSVYTCTECHQIAFECEAHRGAHINADMAAVRIVDAAGRPAPLGESGEVVISNLVNRATVLLNYRLGDIAALLPDPCPCGRSLPLLSLVEGRCDDRIGLPSGRILHPFAIWDIFRFEEQLWQYQVEQVAPTHLRVSVEADPACDRRALEGRIAERLAAAVGGEATWEIAFADSMRRTARGKHRCVLALKEGPAT